MALQHSPSIVTNGLVLCVDAANPRSALGLSILSTAALSNFAANQNVTITQSGSSIQVVSNQNTSTPGAWPIGGTLTVTPSTKYTLRIKGMLVTGSTVYLYVWSNSNGNLVWQGNPLTTTNQYVENTFTTGASDTSIRVGVLWSSPTVGSTVLIDAVEVYNVNNWYDVSGSNNIGALVNSPTYTSGMSGYYTFDGIDDYVNCGNNSTVQQSSAITMSAWVNPTSSTGLGNIMAKNYNSAYRFRIDNGQLWWYVSGTAAVGGSVPNGTWSYCTVTGSSSGLVAYVNGVAVASNGTAFTPSASGTGDLYIGCLQPSVEVFNGKIAMASMYSRALSVTEVLQNFNATRGRYGV